MQDTKGVFDSAMDLLIIGSLAVFGGIARVAMSPKKPRTACEFFLTLVVSGFSGVIMYKLLCAYDVSPDLTAAASGIAGVLGDDLLASVLMIGNEIRKQPAKVLGWWLNRK